jgi:hypothetical protein
LADQLSRIFDELSPRVTADMTFRPSWTTAAGIAKPATIGIADDVVILLAARYFDAVREHHDLIFTVAARLAVSSLFPNT